MSRLAIIPARGGSKRIPRKNIKDFLGKPIIAYSIQAAMNSGLFAEVMVSTDDEEIADIARGFGATVPFLRSPSASNDTATTVDALKEVILTYANKGKTYGAICCIYPTSPFVTVDLLDEGLRLLTTENFDCVFPVLKYSYPIQRSLSLNEARRIKLNHPEYLSARSQDLPDTFHDAGMFYWFKPEPIMKLGKLWTDNTGCIEVKELDAQDIDTLEDWSLAEFKFSYRK